MNAKLKRLYVALGERYDEDISSNINDTHTSLDDGRFEHRITFGSNDPAKNQNIVMSAIHLIGSLKDIIKQKLRENGKDPDVYEQLINNNQPLALVTELDNKDKHGNTLTGRPRSGTDPRIVNIEQALHGHGITRVSFTTDFATGKTSLNSAEGDEKIVIDADIIDSTGNLLMPLDKMLEESLRVVEEFVAAYDLD